MKTARLRYFAACNSEEGFHSFYKDVFANELSRIYIIKGGPGTGKSTLMRRVANRAEERGYRIEEIYCSSDPESLDGVIAYGLDESFAVLDGTAPHVAEMELPGARDEILYIGDFWSSEHLRAQKEDIVREGRMRAGRYRCLYRYLQAAGQCERNMESALLDFLDQNKLSAAISRILSRYPIGDAFTQKVMLTSSLGMSGAFRFDTFEEVSETVYIVSDCGGMAYRLFEEVYRCARERRMRLWVSYDPLIPTHINGICMPDCGLSFVMADREGRNEWTKVHHLSMKRYVSSDGYRSVQKALALAQKNKERLMSAAMETLQEIRKLHFSIESRYVAAMDFAAMREYSDRWLEKILP